MIIQILLSLDGDDVWKVILGSCWELLAKIRSASRVLGKGLEMRTEEV